MDQSMVSISQGWILLAIAAACSTALEASPKTIAARVDNEFFISQDGECIAFATSNSLNRDHASGKGIYIFRRSDNKLRLMARSIQQFGPIEQIELIGLTDDCEQLAYQRWTNSSSSIVMASVKGVFADPSTPSERVLTNVSSVARPVFLRLASDGSALAWSDRLSTRGLDSAVYVLLLQDPSQSKTVVPGSTSSGANQAYPVFLGPNANWVLLSGNVGSRDAGSPVLVTNPTKLNLSASISINETGISRDACAPLQVVSISGDGITALIHVNDDACVDRSGPLKPALVPGRYFAFDFSKGRATKLAFVDKLRSKGHVTIHTMSKVGDKVLVSTMQQKNYKSHSCTQVCEVYGKELSACEACLDTGFGSEHQIVRGRYSADGNWLVLSLLDTGTSTANFHVVITKSVQ